MAGAILIRVVAWTGNTHSGYRARGLMSRAAQGALCEHSCRAEVLPRDADSPPDLCDSAAEVLPRDADSAPYLCDWVAGKSSYQ